jgi:hypothetical protein
MIDLDIPSPLLDDNSNSFDHKWFTSEDLDSEEKDAAKHKTTYSPENEEFDILPPVWMGGSDDDMKPQMGGKKKKHRTKELSPKNTLTYRSLKRRTVHEHEEKKDLIADEYSTNSADFSKEKSNALYRATHTDEIQSKHSRRSSTRDNLSEGRDPTQDNLDDGGIDLTVNGRLFPTWVASRFRKFRLPEINRDPDEDPCNTKKTGRDELRKYQQFLASYLSYKSRHKRALLYHFMGSGKTATIINLYNVLYHHSPQWNVFILIRAALHDDPWVKELRKWMRGDDVKDMYANIHFVHYDSPFAGRDFMEQVRMSDTSKQNMYVIDEAHNFILNVYSNITTGQGTRAKTIYDHIQRDVKEHDNTRAIAISGTPAVNSPYELALVFNLLRPGIFPDTEAEFNEHFLSSSGSPILDPARRNEFQRLILGLASYYIGATPDVYASQAINPISLMMERHQQEVYRHYEEMESRAAMKSTSGASGSMYRTYTRQACNFVFPDIDHKVSGMKRPRPNHYRMSQRDALKLMEGRGAEVKVTGEGDQFMDVTGFLEAMKMYVDRTREWFQDIAEKDQKEGRTILDDFAVYRDKYKGKFLKFKKAGEGKSNLFKAMYQCSPKMTFIAFSILRAPGPTVVYSGFVKMEGLEMFKMYLDLIGFKLWEEGDTDRLTYGEFTGDREREDRVRYRDAFNAKSNIHGKQMKVILFSPAGVEGVSLRNVREIHIMEAHWHEVRIAQMIGRGIRQCSHADLPMKDRHVDIYRYTMIRESGRETTDQYINGIARAKETMIQSFLESVKEAAVDCHLNYEHDRLGGEYKCFQFEEDSLFDKNPGPAFRFDLVENSKISQGSNAPGSQTLRVKVMRIKAVQRLKNDKFTAPKDFWWYPESGTIYDFEMKVPLAKIELDPSSKLPVKIGENYIIGQIIQGVELY